MVKNHDNSLFKNRIGHQNNWCHAQNPFGYENAGRLTPAVKYEKSGYHSYSAEDTVIQAISSLQSLGLTLKEVEAYYYCTDH